MKRVALCAAVAAIMLIPAEAISASRTYTGTADADPATALTLKTKTKKGKRKVRLARAENLLIDCSDGEVAARLTLAELGPVGKVRKSGKFEGEGSNGLQTIAVEGKLAGSTITGTFRYFGFTEVGDETMGCDSGKVAFTATR